MKIQILILENTDTNFSLHVSENIYTIFMPEPRCLADLLCFPYRVSSGNGEQVPATCCHGATMDNYADYINSETCTSTAGGPTNFYTEVCPVVLFPIPFAEECNVTYENLIGVLRTVTTFRLRRKTKCLMSVRTNSKSA